MQPPVENQKQNKTVGSRRITQPTTRETTTRKKKETPLNVRLLSFGADCQKVLTLYGVSNLVSEDEHSLDIMDPYQRDAKIIGTLMRPPLPRLHSDRDRCLADNDVTAVRRANREPGKNRVPRREETEASRPDSARPAHWLPVTSLFGAVKRNQSRAREQRLLARRPNECFVSCFNVVFLSLRFAAAVWEKIMRGEFKLPAKAAKKPTLQAHQHQPAIFNEVHSTPYEVRVRPPANFVPPPPPPPTPAAADADADADAYEQFNETDASSSSTVVLRLGRSVSSIPDHEAQLLQRLAQQ